MVSKFFSCFCNMFCEMINTAMKGIYHQQGVNKLMISPCVLDEKIHKIELFGIWPN
jgi:hypothetical protein